MEQNTPKFRLRLNLFDGIILVAALIAAAVLIWFARNPTPTNKDDVVSGTIRYTLRLNQWPNGVSDLVQIGDRLTENTKNYELGEIVDIKVEPCRIQAVDLEAGKRVLAELEGYDDVVVTLETACEIGKYDVEVEEEFLRVGNLLHARGDGYMGSGFVESIEIIDRQEVGG